jgi:hypothetical protein
MITIPETYRYRRKSSASTSKRAAFFFLMQLFSHEGCRTLSAAAQLESKSSVPSAFYRLWLTLDFPFLPTASER